jgi:hypothetical protein
MRRRAAVLRRARGMCERCHHELALEVHHLGGLGDNRLEALLAVCKSCHAQLEAEKRG